MEYNIQHQDPSSQLAFQNIIKHIHLPLFEKIAKRTMSWSSLFQIQFSALYCHLQSLFDMSTLQKKLRNFNSFKILNVLIRLLSLVDDVIYNDVQMMLVSSKLHTISAQKYIFNRTESHIYGKKYTQ